MRAFLLIVLVLTPSTAANGQQVDSVTGRLKDVEAWARADTNDARRQYYLGLAQWKHHHWRETDSLLRLAVRLEPRFSAAYFALYFLPFARRTSLDREITRNRVPKEWRPVLEEAQGFYRRAFRTDPLLSMEVMGVAFEIEEPTESDRRDPAYALYLRYYGWMVDLGLGRYQSARERLERLAEREYDGINHPERVPDFILWYRGLAAAHTAQYDAAIVDFRALLQRANNQERRAVLLHVPLRDNEYRFMLAYLHQLAGHADSAVALYQEALEHDLGLVMAHTYLASIYDATGRVEAALLERQRAAEINSDDPTVLFDLAASFFNGGQLAEAEEPLRRAIALNGRYSPSYYLLARAEEERGLIDEAREGYKRFLSLAPLRLEALRSDAQQRLDSLPK